VGRQIAIVSTHYGEDSDFVNLIQNVQDGKEKASLHRVTLDDALQQGLFKQICLVNQEEWNVEKEKAWRDKIIAFYGDDSDEELFCIPAKGGGVYISRETVKKCATLSADGILRLDSRHGLLDDPTTRRAIVQAWCDGEIKRRLSLITGDAFLGSDFARSSDLSVLVVGCKGRDGDVAFPLVIEMRGHPARSAASNR